MGGRKHPKTLQMSSPNHKSQAEAPATRQAARQKHSSLARRIPSTLYAPATLHDGTLKRPSLVRKIPASRPCSAPAAATESEISMIQHSDTPRARRRFRTKFLGRSDFQRSDTRGYVESVEIPGAPRASIILARCGSSRRPRAPEHFNQETDQTRYITTVQGPGDHRNIHTSDTSRRPLSETWRQPSIRPASRHPTTLYLAPSYTFQTSRQPFIKAIHPADADKTRPPPLT